MSMRPNMPYILLLLGMVYSLPTDTIVPESSFIEKESPRCQHTFQCVDKCKQFMRENPDQVPEGEMTCEEMTFCNDKGRCDKPSSGGKHPPCQHTFQCVDKCKQFMRENPDKVPEGGMTCEEMTYCNKDKGRCDKPSSGGKPPSDGEASEPKPPTCGYGFQCRNFCEENPDKIPEGLTCDMMFCNKDRGSTCDFQPPKKNCDHAFAGRYQDCLNGRLKADFTICPCGKTDRVFTMYDEDGCRGNKLYTHFSPRIITEARNAAPSNTPDAKAIDVKAVSDVYIPHTAAAAEDLKSKCPGTHFEAGKKTRIPDHCGQLNLGHVGQCRNWYKEARLTTSPPGIILAMKHTLTERCFSSPSWKGCNENDRCVVPKDCHHCWAPPFPKTGPPQKGVCGAGD